MKIIYLTGTKLTCRDSGDEFVVTYSDPTMTKYRNADSIGECRTPDVVMLFVPDAEPIVQPTPEEIDALRRPQSALDVQIGGEHYKTLGDYQPWEVLRHWLTPDEFRGYMKGTAITYLARERQKGGMQDIQKACHTLEGLIELEDR
jgi:hypothetical protein